MKRQSYIRLFFLFVLVIPVTIFAILNFYENTLRRLPVLGQPGHRIEDFHLVNQEGQMKSTKDWQRKIVVADFFYTHCPTVCPRMTNNLKIIDDHFKNDDHVRINSFSVDPVHDSAGQLKKYISQFALKTTRWDFLTGSKKEIYKLARNSFMVVATDGDGGPDDFIHSDKLVLIDGQKRIRGYYDGTDKKEIGQLVKDIKRLENEN